MGVWVTENFWREEQNGVQFRANSGKIEKEGSIRRFGLLQQPLTRRAEVYKQIQVDAGLHNLLPTSSRRKAGTVQNLTPLQYAIVTDPAETWWMNDRES